MPLHVEFGGPPLYTSALGMLPGRPVRVYDLDQLDTVYVVDDWRAGQHYEQGAATLRLISTRAAVEMMLADRLQPAQAAREPAVPAVPDVPLDEGGHWTTAKVASQLGVARTTLDRRIKCHPPEDQGAARVIGGGSGSRTHRRWLPEAVAGWWEATSPRAKAAPSPPRRARPTGGPGRNRRAKHAESGGPVDWTAVARVG